MEKATVAEISEAAQAFADASAAQDRALLAALQARPKVDDLRVRLSNDVLQRPNRATRRAMAKAARRSPRQSK